MLSLLMVLVTNQLALAQQATFVPHKNCGLQPMTDWQIEQHPEYAEELKKYHNKIMKNTSYRKTCKIFRIFVIPSIWIS